jgi:RNA polymerase sigma-70 factor (ECF subfamily)
VTADRPSRRDELEHALHDDGDRLYALALRVTRDPDMAADAVHDGFAAAIEGLDDFRGDAAVSTWLYRIVYRKAIDLLRRRGREVPLDEERDLGIEEKPSRADSWARPPDEILLGAEARRALDEALATLPAAQRAVFELREMEERSTEEVAERLGMPAATVRVYVHRARMKLREALAPLFKGARA